MRDRLNTSREVHGDRATIVVGGVTTSQGVPESGAQGKGWQEKHLRTVLSWQAVKCVSPFLFSIEEMVSLESRIPGNSSVRFGKGELETCQRPEYGSGECRFNRSR